MDLRKTKLRKLFVRAIHGESLSPEQQRNFLVAISTEQDEVACLNEIIASSGGIDALRTSIQSNPTLDFMNHSIPPLLSYLASPKLIDVDAGRLLKRILLAIVEPPELWNPFVDAFKNDDLESDAMKSFAWLLWRLVSLPDDDGDGYRPIAQDPVILHRITSSPSSDVKNYGYQIRKVLMGGEVLDENDSDNPGGRHDNDFVSFRDINILPTADELRCTQPPFLRTSNDVELATEETYFDNQFRLLREDLLGELKEEIKSLFSGSGAHMARFEGCSLKYIHTMYYTFSAHGKVTARQHWCKYGLTFQSWAPIDRLTRNSYVTLVVGGEVAAFPVVGMDTRPSEDEPPSVVLLFPDDPTLRVTLARIKQHPEDISIVLLQTPIFAFQPVLRSLQRSRGIQLSKELFGSSNLVKPIHIAPHITQVLRDQTSWDLQDLLSTPGPVLLDQSQRESLISGLTQRVSLIQGPPGTGKSYIGALLAKILHDHTSKTILVVCYTNHALDQFLEDLLKIGIPGDSMVRLGSKSTPATVHLSLQELKRSVGRFGQQDWYRVNDLQDLAQDASVTLRRAFSAYKSLSIPYEMLGHIAKNDPEYHAALQTPKSSDGMVLVGKGGKAVESDYLLQRWMGGKDAGVFRTHMAQNHSEVWGTTPSQRQEALQRWENEIMEPILDRICDAGAKYDARYQKISDKFSQGERIVLADCRIVGCTTTGAAMFAESIERYASPGVLLVEEAGEILESHILASLGKSVGQLILIGDHKQLPPKVNDFNLTTDSHRGYNLDQSTFKRLVLNGYSHVTLRQQHRMRPEISNFCRQLTYPDLEDAPGTKGRPDIDGVQGVVVFIDHQHPEETEIDIGDRRDFGSKTSRTNSYEASMVVKIARYLLQQGYEKEKIAILTPYLGQMRTIKSALTSAALKSSLSERDIQDLTKAGLYDIVDGEVKGIRLATIDNYQGEECDIVIASLTRSNKSGDIGFMASPERLNVLLSRARIGMIFIGNSTTFLKSKRGGSLWGSFVGLMKEGAHIYQGLPVVCQRHPDHKAELKEPVDFENECPDGGCGQSCDALLGCGAHRCPLRCHPGDHTLITCKTRLSQTCQAGLHPQRFMCCRGPPTSCMACSKESEDIQVDYDGIDME